VQAAVVVVLVMNRDNQVELLEAVDQVAAEMEVG
jgi:hypothetical protein